MNLGKFFTLLFMIGLCLSGSKLNRLLSMKQKVKPFPSQNVLKRGMRTEAEEIIGHVDTRFWVPKYNHLEYLAEGKQNGFEKIETDFMLLFAKMTDDIEKSVTAGREKLADARKESGCSVVEKLMSASMAEVLSFSPTLSKWLDVFNRFCTTEDEDAKALVVQKIERFGFRAKERPAFFDMKHKFSILPRLKGTTYWFGVLEKLLREEKEEAFESFSDMVDGELPEDFVEETYTEGEFPSEEELDKYIQEHADELPEGLVDGIILEDIVDEQFGPNFDEEDADTFPDEDEDILEEFPDIVDEQFFAEFDEEYPTKEFDERFFAEEFDEEFDEEYLAEEFGTAAEDFVEFERDVYGFEELFPKSILENILEDDPKATEALGFCMWEDHFFRKNTGYKQGKATKYDCHCPAAKCTWTCEEGECYTCLTQKMFKRAMKQGNTDKIHAWKDNCDIDLAEFGRAGWN